MAKRGRMYQLEDIIDSFMNDPDSDSKSLDLGNAPAVQWRTSVFCYIYVKIL